MSTFNELMQKYVNTDYPVLLDLAREAIQRLMPACKQVDPQHNGFYMLSSIILSVIGRDGVLSQLEKKLLIESTDIEENLIDKFLSMYDPKMPDLVDHFCDNMGDDLKADVIILATVFAAVDETISKEETEFIRKLLG